MDDERLKRCNKIRSELSDLESTRDGISSKLVLSINNMTLEDKEAIFVAKEAILALYDSRIVEKRKEFEES